MKNEFSIFNFPIKTEKWKLKNFYHFSIFSFEVKIEMLKNVLFHFNFKMKIEWHFRCTDWISSTWCLAIFIDEFCSVVWRSIVFDMQTQQFGFSPKQVLLKISQDSRENKHLSQGLFWINLQTWSFETLLKRYSSTGVLLWVLRKF